MGECYACGQDVEGWTPEPAGSFEAERLTRERDAALLHQQRLGAAMQDEIRGRHAAERERDEALAQYHRCITVPELGWAEADARIMQRIAAFSRNVDTPAAIEMRDALDAAKTYVGRVVRERDDARAVIERQDRIIRMKDERIREAEISVIGARAEVTQMRGIWEVLQRALNAEQVEHEATKQQLGEARAERDHWIGSWQTATDAAERLSRECLSIWARVAELESRLGRECLSIYHTAPRNGFNRCELDGMHGGPHRWNGRRWTEEDGEREQREEESKS